MSNPSRHDRSAGECASVCTAIDPETDRFLSETYFLSSPICKKSKIVSSERSLVGPRERRYRNQRGAENRTVSEWTCALASNLMSRAVDEINSSPFYLEGKERTNYKLPFESTPSIAFNHGRRGQPSWRILRFCHCRKKRWSLEGKRPDGDVKALSLF